MKRIRCIFFALVAMIFVCVAVHADSIVFDKYNYGGKYFTVRFRYNYDQQKAPYDCKANLEIHLGNKTCKKTVWLKNGDCSFTVPIQGVYKIGTPIRVNLKGKQFNGRGKSFNFTKTGKVGYPETNYTWYWFTSSSRQLEIDVDHAHKGDIILVKIGDKGYWKTITTDHIRNWTYHVKIDPSEAGSKVVVWMVNKYKQIIANKSSNIVYKYDNIERCKTKSDVMLTMDWNKPIRKRKMTDSEIWYYKAVYEYEPYVVFDSRGRIIEYCTVTSD